MKKASVATNRVRGFTLIELLVVIAIIGLLGTLAVVQLTNAAAKGRDTKRKSDLKAIQKALELYYNDNGSYPSTGGFWHGTCASYGPYQTSGPSGYIAGLAPAYIGKLPVDPNSRTSPITSTICGTGNTQTCYLYFSDGVHYKALAHCTIESTVPRGDPFYDQVRPQHAYMVCDGDPTACNTW